MASRTTSHLVDQVIVITGASSGIGAALAILVGERGGKPVLVARRAEELAAVAARSGPHALASVPFATIRSAYSASKAALNILSASLRMELRAELPPDAQVHVSTVLVGPVATDFGNSALHGGIDSRKLPNLQTAEEVAAVLVDTLEHPRADVYSRPEYRAQIAAYYAAEDVAVVEERVTSAFRAPRP